MVLDPEESSIWYPYFQAKGKQFAYESPIEELYYDRSVVPMEKPLEKIEMEEMIQAAVVCEKFVYKVSHVEMPYHRGRSW